MIRKILIANRGEIAIRIIRACREMGIETVAVYSEADREALHSQLADEAVCIGPAPAKDSYLNMEQIISATIVSGADAIHPGFGFLSENSRFAQLCETCNITFIGPNAQTIARLGNKAVARKTMLEAKVPVIPGSEEPVTEEKRGREIAREIGFPVIIKAVLGGGGKGMRVAEKEEDFSKAFLTAQKEAEAAFGDRQMYHLGESDCSIQRHHQKMIDESPSFAVSDALRVKMVKAAVQAAKVAGYTNAGTIEFLLDQEENFYFMEMNTRIQVEHPVTEWVTGIDLVKEQIRIASGKPLSYRQEDVQIKGHAIECRINAEDPKHHFRPCPGTITDMYLPGGKGIRLDSAIYSGYTISPYYDSMIAKLIVYAKSRKEAIAKMHSALGEVIIEGITTNIDFLYEIMEREDYQEGEITISYMDHVLEEMQEERKWI